MKAIGKKNRKLNKKKSRFLKGRASSGTLYVVAILAIVAVFAGVLVGGVTPQISNLAAPTPPVNSYSCCDSGEGADCHPILEKEITFNGDTYGLLKSEIYQNELGHIVPAELDTKHGYPASYTPDGHKIFVNTTDHISDYIRKDYGCDPGKDLIETKSGCFGVKDEELIYVCKDTQEKCEKPENILTVPFDVYYRVKDGAVPEQITTQCTKPKGDASDTGQQVINLPTPSGTANLQLQTFQVRNKTKSFWLSAWCKPADYFYPTEKTNIQFDVKPLGELTYTMPVYPKGGWNFTAFPDGNLLYQGQSYPYIYWDAAIPNNLIHEPQTGYSVAYIDLSNFLSTLLPKLGLSQKETKDFTLYWTKQLPKSNYYFIGVIPQEQINTLAPLVINPYPDSLLRVNLYFKPMDKRITISAPQIASFTRKGFSVVEWGGIFNTESRPGFSCLM